MTKFILRITLALTTLSALVWLPPRTIADARRGGLTRQELRTLRQASSLAARSPRRAVSWLLLHVNGAHSALSPDGTILVRFSGGNEVAILPPHPNAVKLPSSLKVRDSALSTGSNHQAAVNGRALVLEPFADELNLGAKAGQTEVDALSSAGFSVDVKRNAEVTIPVMENLNQYSAVYMETHSNILPNGDGIVVTGETDFHPYASMAPTQFGGDGSLMQAIVAGDPKLTLYIAIISNFVRLHVGQFPEQSIVFLNGCDLLRAPLLWQALQNKRVGALISWDQQADVSVTDRAAEVVVRQLANGKSVAASISAAYDAGLGVSPSFPPAHLGYLGAGEDTLATIGQTVTPGATVTPTLLPPVVTPTPTATIPRFNFTLVGVRFEGNGTRANLHRPRLMSVKRGSAVRLSLYYRVVGATKGCRYHETLALSLKQRQLKIWKYSFGCHGGTHRDSIPGVKLTKPGTYTLTGRVQVNKTVAYSTAVTLKVR